MDYFPETLEELISDCPNENLVLRSVLQIACSVWQLLVLVLWITLRW